MTLSERYVIALGSNLGDREGLIRAAMDQAAKALGPLEAAAPLYATAPVGAADRPFLNTAILVASAAPPEAALARLLEIEGQLGRVRREKWGNRTIDLDVLLWRRGDDPSGAPSRRYASTTLRIPHPYLLERDFALVPAADVAPDWVHPDTGRTLAEERAARGFRLTAAPRP